MKKRLLIAWGNPYMFDGNLSRVLPKLADRFEVDVLLSDWWVSDVLKQKLGVWKRQGLIRDFILLPSDDHLLRLHWEIFRKIKRLRTCRFDMMLMLSAMQVFERYLVECVASENCVRVCYSPGATFLLRSDRIAAGLLRGVSPSDLLLGEPQSGHTRSSGKTDLPVVSLSFRRTMRSWRLRAYRYRESLKRGSRWFLDRYLLPLLVARRTFSLGRYDMLTQIGTDQFDVLLVEDQVEADAFSALYTDRVVRAVKSPNQGICRCPCPVRPAILTCLSGWYVDSDQVPQAMLESYLRDLRIVSDRVDAKEVHVRPHPRTTGRWPHELVAYLRAGGLAASIAGLEQSIADVACGYAAVAGIASSALRDARTGCDYVPVIGFMGVSRMCIHDPKLLFGEGHGIDWIEEDGTCGNIERNLHLEPTHPRLDDVLASLCG